MQNNDRIKYFLFETNNPIYVKNAANYSSVKTYPYFEINANNQRAYSEDLTKFIKENNDIKSFIIFNMNTIAVNIQKALTSIIKDRTYNGVSLPENCKIIVTGNKEYINKELYGLLVVADV